MVSFVAISNTLLLLISICTEPHSNELLVFVWKFSTDVYFYKVKFWMLVHVDFNHIELYTQ